MKTITSIWCSILLGALMFSQGINAETGLIEVSGVVEVEFTAASVDGGKDPDNAGDPLPDYDQSDVALATLAIGMDTDIADNVSAHILLLHEEDDTPLEIDEGIITWGDAEDGLYVSGGQMYVPFGTYETNMISDPLTLELGETRETALLVGFNRGFFGGAFYVFNGDSIKRSSDTDKGSDTLEHMGFSLNITTEWLDVGVDYISSIADSDYLQEMIFLEANDDASNPEDVRYGLKNYVAGISVRATATFGMFNVLFENVTALDKFQKADFRHTDLPGGTVKRREPSSNKLEVGMDLNGHIIAGAFQNTANAEQLGLPEIRFLVAYATAVADRTTITAEYMFQEDYDYSQIEGTTGKSSDNFAIQLAVEF